MGRNSRLLIGLFAAVALVVTALLLNRGGSSEASPPPDASPTPADSPPEDVVLAADPAHTKGEAQRAEVALAPIEVSPGTAPTTLTISVRLEKNGAPVTGVRIDPLWTEDVLLADGPHQWITDEEGAARVYLTRGTILDGVSVKAGPTTTEETLRRPIPIATGSAEVILVEVTSGATVSGTVVDLDGRPVPRAVVGGWCTWPWILEREPRADPDREVVADDAGRFTVPHLGRRFVIEPAAEGMACLAFVHGELAAGDDVEGVELVLGPAGRIDGRVLDPGGNPVGSVEIESDRGWGSHTGATEHPGVFRANPSAVKAVSAADGTFAFTGLAPWSYRFRVDHSGFDRWTGSHAPGDGFLEIHLQQGLELVGRILDAAGSPLPGAEVRLRRNRETTTDGEGRFRLAGLEEDLLGMLFVQAPGHAILVHQPLPIRADAPNEVELRLEREKVIAGRVVDVEGAGVANAIVEIEGDRIVDYGRMFMRPTPTWERRHRVNSTRTDAEGSFRLDRLYAGSFRVTATDPDEPTLQAVATVDSGIEDLELTLDPNAVQGVTLVGRVTDAITGEAVSRFEVYPWSMDPGWVDTSGMSFIDEDGNYEVGGLVPASIRVWFDGDGYCRTMIPARDYAPGKHQLDALLFPKRTLDLRVVDPDGGPFAGVYIWFEDESGENIYYDSVAGGWNWTHRLDPNGEAKLSNLPAALLTFVVGGTLGAEPARFEVDLRIQPEGVQQFVVDARRPAHLDLFLMGTTSAPELGQVREVDGAEDMRKLLEERKDVWMLDAPSFEIIVRDATGEVGARVTATTEDAREWMVHVAEGDTGFTSNAYAPQVQFAVPRDAIDIEVTAEGHRPFTFRLREDEISRPGVTTIPRVLFLQKDP